MSYFPFDFGTTLKTVRTSKGWSQEKMALEAGLNPAFLGHLERGLKSPTLSTVDKILKALDMSLDEFIKAGDLWYDKDNNPSYIKDAINFQLSNLSQEELEKIYDIIVDIKKFKNL
ncbi:MAG: helix-turn-helix domain-containing protein [Succinivibrionaceae bacterium]